MRASKVIEIIVATLIGALSLASTAQAADTRELARVSAPQDQTIVLAQAPQHFSGYQARVSERTRELQAVPSAAPRESAASWYARKTGTRADSSAAGSSAVTPLSRFHDRLPNNCNATVTAAMQRPWCG